MREEEYYNVIPSLLFLLSPRTTRAMRGRGLRGGGRSKQAARFGVAEGEHGV